MLAADCIKACLPHAKARNVTLILENHYKDNYWQFPEFAQKMDVFCELVEQMTPRDQQAVIDAAKRFYRLYGAIFGELYQRHFGQETH